MRSFNCLNCGDQVELPFDYLKLTTCSSCGTTLFLADSQARLAGDQGIMHDAPLLFGLGDTVTFGTLGITMYGHARFSYGRGFWDEFWGATDTGEPRWVSVDEGDIVIQRALPEAQSPKIEQHLETGSEFLWNRDIHTVVEVGTGECVAVRGSFDEELRVGETYRYINATSDIDTFLSGEFWPGGQRWFEGRWFDPYDIKIERAA